MAGSTDPNGIKPLNATAREALGARLEMTRERARVIHLMRYAEYKLT